jgi:TATA-binding protein-associated factor Taf7
MRWGVVICSQLMENKNTSVTNMAEYLAAEVIEEHGLTTPLTWVEH